MHRFVRHCRVQALSSGQLCAPTNRLTIRLRHCDHLTLHSPLPVAVPTCVSEYPPRVLSLQTGASLSRSALLPSQCARFTRPIKKRPSSETQGRCVTAAAAAASATKRTIQLRLSIVFQFRLHRSSSSYRQVQHCFRLDSFPHKNHCEKLAQTHVRQCVG